MFSTLLADRRNKIFVLLLYARLPELHLLFDVFVYQTPYFAVLHLIPTPIVDEITMLLRY